MLTSHHLYCLLSHLWWILFLSLLDPSRRATTSEILKKKWLVNHKDLFPTPHKNRKRSKCHELTFGQGRHVEESTGRHNNKRVSENDNNNMGCYFNSSLSIMSSALSEFHQKDEMTPDDEDGYKTTITAARVNPSKTSRDLCIEDDQSGQSQFQTCLSRHHYRHPLNASLTTSTRCHQARSSSSSSRQGLPFVYYRVKSKKLKEKKKNKKRDKKSH